MPPKRKGFEFHEKDLKGARLIVAPMVDASELAWRILSRRHGAELCYTPMLHAGVFVRDERYRAANLQSCPEDRPLIVQFCANDPEVLKEAVGHVTRMIECDAVDLNLGCPQVIARRGHFGAFLQDEWDLIQRMVSSIHDNYSLPITCKTRIFPDVQRSVDYAKMLQSAGCQLITVHGRTREQRGPLTGVASWEHIAAVVKAVDIPVFANGNIQHFSDVQRCLEATGACGVMSAEGNLCNPAIFDHRVADDPPAVWTVCSEYLVLADRHPCPLGYVRGHIFKMLHAVLRLPENFDVREMVAKAQSVGRFREAVAIVRRRCEGRKVEGGPPDRPPWVCQPYVRMSPDEYNKKMEDASLAQDDAGPKRMNGDQAFAAIVGEEDGQNVSKKRLKRISKCPHKKLRPAGTIRETVFKDICRSCPNPAGLKCDIKMCRKCCKQRCFAQELDCLGHKILVGIRRRKAVDESREAGDIQPDTG